MSGSCLVHGGQLTSIRAADPTDPPSKHASTHASTHARTHARNVRERERRRHSGPRPCRQPVSLVESDLPGVSGHLTSDLPPSSQPAKKARTQCAGAGGKEAGDLVLAAG
eukprot:828403-Rhodomonas_salina.1